jgi:uncharacterized protein
MKTNGRKTLLNWRSVLLLVATILTLILADSGVAAGPDSSKTPLAVVKGLYAAFDRGDMTAVLAAVSPNVVWTYYGPNYAIPFAGEFHGRDGVAYFFQLAEDATKDIQAGQSEYFVSGDHVFVRGWEECTVRSTGSHYKVNNVHVFTVVDGQITRFEEYIDDADVLEGMAPADIGRGRALFTTCAGCHGNHAEGRPAMRAPNLTGLDSTYLALQLTHFRAAIRGNESDTYGYMMMGRAGALPGDRGVRDVAAYIAGLPVKRSRVSTSGNAERGQKLYAGRCASCHGSSAQGDRSLGAPPLRQQDLNYLHTQLEHFVSGVRGAASLDAGGAAMRSAVASLQSPQDIDDVVAFIGSE